MLYLLPILAICFFKPSEMLAKADIFDMKESRSGAVQTPQVHGDSVSILWRPYRDSMYISSETAPFAIFRSGKHTVAGTLILTPGGFKGNGLLEWDKAGMRSKLLSFGANSVKADTSNIDIRTIGVEGVAIRTKNVNSDVDFDKKIGKFKANTPGEWTCNFPYNQYQTSLNEFIWYMDEETIVFKSEKGVKGKFRSVHPDLDSLNFEGETAYYDLKSNELRMGGVEYLIAADAFVYPDSGLVAVQAGGEMRTLENARIIADTLNRNHVINRATVNRARQTFVACKDRSTLTQRLGMKSQLRSQSFIQDQQSRLFDGCRLPALMKDRGQLGVLVLQPPAFRRG